MAQAVRIQSVSWKYEDASTGFLSNMNPMRWSGKVNRTDGIKELRAADGGRPIHVRFFENGSNLIADMTFSNKEETLQFVYQEYMQKQPNCDTWAGGYLGPDGCLTRAVEYVPVAGQVVGLTHAMMGKSQTADRGLDKAINSTSYVPGLGHVQAGALLAKGDTVTAGTHFSRATGVAVGVAVTSATAGAGVIAGAISGAAGAAAGSSAQAFSELFVVREAKKEKGKNLSEFAGNLLTDTGFGLVGGGFFGWMFGPAAGVAGEAVEQGALVTASQRLSSTTMRELSEEAIKQSTRKTVQQVGMKASEDVFVTTFMTNLKDYAVGGLSSSDAAKFGKKLGKKIFDNLHRFIAEIEAEGVN